VRALYFKIKLINPSGSYALNTAFPSTILLLPQIACRPNCPSDSKFYQKRN
jgi:hypothetical protein